MKPAQLAQAAVVVIAAFAVFMFVLTARDGETRRACAPLCALQPNYANRNRLAPDFELPTLQGPRRKLSDYRGQVVILNFWTKTCRPCLEEMPSLAELGRVLKQHPGIRLVTISTDDTREDVQQTLQSLLGGPAPFDVFIDAEAEVVTGKFGTKLYPETWFIDPRGVIRARVDGARDWSAATALDFAKSLSDPLTCAVDFQRGRATGELSGLCADFGHAG